MGAQTRRHRTFHPCPQQGPWWFSAVSCLLQSTQAHENNRDIRLAWTGIQEYLVSTGFNQMREREAKLWDTRVFSSALASITLDTSPGSLIPLLDPDSGLLVLAGKGENQLYCYEVTPQQPALSPGE